MTGEEEDIVNEMVIMDLVRTEEEEARGGGGTGSHMYPHAGYRAM